MIFTVGILNLYSATNGSAIGPHAGVYKTQIVYFIFSLCVGLVVSFIDVKNNIPVLLPDLFFQYFLINSRFYFR